MIGFASTMIKCDAPMIYVNSEGQLDFQVIQQSSITRPPSDHVQISDIHILN
jgi:hypothetical protein